MAKKGTMKPGELPIETTDLPEIKDELTELLGVVDEFEDAIEAGDWRHTYRIMQQFFIRAQSVAAWTGQYLHRTQTYCMAVGIPLEPMPSKEDAT